MADTAPEALVRHAGALVVAALVALTLLAWLALLAGAGTDMDPAAMSFWLVPTALLPALSSPWTPAYWLIAFHVGRHDGGDDAAVGCAHGAALCPGRAAGGEPGAANACAGFDRGLRVRLSHLVDSFQRLGRSASGGT